MRGRASVDHQTDCRRETVSHERDYASLPPSNRQNEHPQPRFDDADSDLNDDDMMEPEDEKGHDRPGHALNERALEPAESSEDDRRHHTLDDDRQRERGHVFGPRDRLRRTMIRMPMMPSTERPSAGSVTELAPVAGGGGRSA